MEIFEYCEWTYLIWNIYLLEYINPVVKNSVIGRTVHNYY